MLTAVDTSVLLDVLTDSAAHADSSEHALREAAGEGGLIICECVLAEIRPAFASPGQVDQFLADWELRFVPSSRESALLAGEIFAAYLRRARKRGGIIADFLIAAHAKLHADRLLVRDRGYLRDYFSSLKVFLPKGTGALGSGDSGFQRTVAIASHRGTSAGPYHADLGRGDPSEDVSQLVIQNCVPQSKCHHS